MARGGLMEGPKKNTAGPQIMTVTPSNGSCADGETVSIDGANLENATAVTVWGAPALLTHNTSHTIVVWRRKSTAYVVESTSSS